MAAITLRFRPTIVLTFDLIHCFLFHGLLKAIAPFATRNSYIWKMFANLDYPNSQMVLLFNFVIVLVQREYVYSVAVFKQISNEVGIIDNFQTLARKLSFLPTSLDIFDIRQHYIRLLFIFHNLTCLVLLSLTPTNINLAVYGNGLAVVMTS